MHRNPVDVAWPMPSLSSFQSEMLTVMAQTVMHLAEEQRVSIIAEEKRKKCLCFSGFGG